VLSHIVLRLNHKMLQFTAFLLYLIMNTYTVNENGTVVIYQMFTQKCNYATYVFIFKLFIIQSYPVKMYT